MKKKILTVSQLKKNLKAHPQKKVVFTNGCFDIIHYGHVKYLAQAKSKGDLLVIGLNSDKSTKKIKGKNRPINFQADRARVLAAFECVDYIVIFNEDTPYKLIQTIKPDLLVKGGDWPKGKIVGSDIVIKGGGKVLSIPYIKNRSTTNIIKKIEKRAY